MIKGHSILGLKVIGHDDGMELGVVRDLIFDHDTDQVLALLLSDRDLFGLIDAQIVPWEAIQKIGDDAVVVTGSRARVKAGADPQVKRVMNRDTALSGTKIYTTEGKYIGTMGDVLLDETTGRIEGFEVSDGLVKDTVSGKRYVAANENIELGRDVAFIPPEVGTDLEAQKHEPGGLHRKFMDAGESARQASRQAYQEVANASIEKQRNYVIGKTASRDVIIPPLDATETTRESVVNEPDEIAVVEAGGMAPSVESELLNPAQVTATDVSGEGEVVEGEVIVRRGEIITAEHADRAIAAGVLHQLVLSAAGIAAHDTAESGSTWTHDMQQRAEQAAIGQPANYSVEAPDGHLIVAKGEIITEPVMQHARRHDKQNAVIGAAGLGAASKTAHEVGESLSKGASSLWETVKQKTGELTHAAERKKAELDQEALQAKINRALGRPTTRVILDQQDNVILNTGDIITHKAVEHAKQAGVLSILLDSVYMETPDIAPEMMRVQRSGDDALEDQVEPEYIEEAPPIDRPDTDKTEQDRNIVL